MIKTATANSAKAEFLQGIHEASDIYKIALFTAKAKLDETTERYTGANEITAEGYEKGGLILSGYSVTLDRGTAILSFNSPTWAKASIVARGAAIYNSSKGNRLLFVFDFVKDIASTNGNFTATVPAPTKETGLIRFT